MGQTSEIIGWGVDARLEDRPGVPEEQTPPRPVTDVAGFPARQEMGRPSVQSRYRPLTAIYSTACPPRLLSGLIRRLAYRTPDYKARRWGLLLLADRIDVIEHNLVPISVAIGAIAAGAIGVRTLARR
jgi:hypothetical protein